jgi:hypothetical protein
MARLKDQFVSFPRAEIFNNRVEQWLMDIQIVRYSSGLLEIAGGDAVRVADNIDRDGIYEHGQDLRSQ